MADDMDFFQGEAPAVETASPGEDGGFTLLGEPESMGPAPGDMAAFVGDVQESSPSDMGFAASPEEMGFAAAPVDVDESASAPILLGAPPPAIEENAVILGEAPLPPSEEPAVVEAEEEAPSAMKKFHEEWQATLEARRAEEDASKAAMEASAKEALEAFQARAQAKREAKMAKNREDEQAKLEAIEADLENDNSWQRVSKMVDLTQDGADNAESTKRMRDIFIMLKNEPGLAAKVGA